MAIFSLFKRPLEMKHIVLFSLLTFFGLIFVANGFLIYFANSSWNGLQYENAYERGIAYNQTLEKRAAEAKMGWEITSQFQQTPLVEPAQKQLFSGVLVYTLTGKNGKALAGAQLFLTISRPIEGGAIQIFNLQTDENGTATQALAFPKAGQWDVGTRVNFEGASLTSQQRIYVKE